MALTEIKDRLALSFENLRTSTFLYDENLKNFKNEIAHAFFDANIPDSLVIEIEGKIQKVIDTIDTSGNRKLLYKIIAEEISSILYPRKPEKIVMFIGLQGLGKSYMCARYARYHMNMGFKSAIVCCDTSKSDGFELIKKMVDTESVLVYKSTDLAKEAREVIANSKELGCDFIAVNTSSRHKECSSLFEEMQGLAKTLIPDRVIFVIDGSIGKVAFEQARAFRETFPTGAVIVTKLKTDQKSFGALAGVAAAGCPTIVYTKGAKGEEFKEHEPDSLARQLMPNQDEDKTPEFAYTFRKMYTYFKKACGYERKVLRGPKPLVDIPTMKLYIQVMDNMTTEELDKSSLSYNRLVQIAAQSKVSMKDVRGMLTTYQRTAKAWMKMEEIWMV